jgi:hypothetical protein
MLFRFEMHEHFPRDEPRAERSVAVGNHRAVSNRSIVPALRFNNGRYSCDNTPKPLGMGADILSPPQARKGTAVERSPSSSSATLWPALATRPSASHHSRGRRPRAI